MSSFSITESAFSGLRLLGRRPLAALVWSAIYIVVFGAIVALFGGAIVNFVSAIAQHGGKPDPAAVIGMIGSVGGFYVLLVIGSVVINGVISCAVYRAELHPDESRFFYMRFGAAEGWLMLVSFVRGLLIFLVQMVFLIPITIVTVAVAAAGAAASGHAAGGAAAGAAMLIGGVLRLAMYGVLIWLYLRFSLAGPMTFVDRQFRLFESWTLTKGQGWRLFAVGLLIGVVGFGLYFILSIVGFAGGFALWGSFPHPATADAFFSQPPAQIMRVLAPFLEWAVVLLFVGGVVMLPVSLAPWAHILRRLKPETDVAKVFE